MKLIITYYDQNHNNHNNKAATNKDNTGAKSNHKSESSKSAVASESLAQWKSKCHRSADRSTKSAPVTTPAHTHGPITQ